MCLKGSDGAKERNHRHTVSILPVRRFGLSIQCPTGGATAGRGTGEPGNRGASYSDSASDVALTAVRSRPIAWSGGAAAVSKATAYSAEDRADRLGVLTFNMEHRDNPKQLAVMAQHLRSDLDEVPEFMLLQEVMFNRSKSKGEDNTAAVLADQLGYYCQGTKRSSDREGIAIASRYPFAFYDAITLKSQTSGLLLGFRRVSVMGEFLVPSIGRVRVVNVHFTNWGFEAHVRYKQLKETIQWIAQRESQVHAVVTIFGGDFNAEPDGGEMPLLTDASVTGDLKFQNFNTSNPTRGGEGHPNKRIDYLFVSAPPQSLNFIKEQRLWMDGLVAKAGDSPFWLSDHVPVMHEYIVQAPRPIRMARQTSLDRTAAAVPN